MNESYVQSLFDAVVVVGVEKAVDFLGLVATEEVDVALHYVRRSAGLLSAGLSACVREREGEREKRVCVCVCGAHELGNLR